MGEPNIQVICEAQDRSKKQGKNGWFTVNVTRAGAMPVWSAPADPALAESLFNNSFWTNE